VSGRRTASRGLIATLVATIAFAALVFLRQDRAQVVEPRVDNSPAVPLPMPHVVHPEIIVPTEQPWYFWADRGSPPPQWPLTAMPDRTGTIDLVWPIQPLSTNHTLQLTPEAGTLVAGRWWVGTHAPYTARSVEEQALRIDEIEAAARRRHERGQPEPLQTTVIYEVDPAEVTAENSGGLENMYFARSFEIDDPADWSSLQAEVEFSAGVIVWINGHEVLRHHVAPGHEEHGNVATPFWLPDWVNQTMYYRWQRTWIGIDPTVLRAGENVISAAVYRRPRGGRRAIFFDMSLMGHRQPGFTKTPYLQRVESDRITVSFESNFPGYGYVSYGQAGQPLGRVAYAAEVAGSSHEVVLHGLEPDTEYTYQAFVVPSPEWGQRAFSTLHSERATFRTSVAPGTPFTFIAYGDNRTQPEIHTQIAQRMWNDAHANDVRLFIHTGDLVTNASPWWEWQLEFFDPMLPLMATYPIYTSLGNHEGNHESYYQYLDLPGNESWYSFRFGDVEFFAINSGADFSPGSPQNTWLTQALADSTAEWKLAFFHHPPWNCTPARKPGDLNVQQMLHPILAGGDVDLVINGHDHLYGRSVPIDGLRYVISGGGGAPSYPAEPDAINEICVRQYHYCRVRVERDTLTLTAVAIDGTILDEFSLSRD
jgi:hypothetical protein